MSRVNPTQTQPRRAETSHLNWMSGSSWDISDPIFSLRLAASSCFFGEPMYYHTDGDKSRRVRDSWTHRSYLSDAQIRYLRETLDAVDPEDWRGLSPAALMERAIDKALDFDPVRTLKLAATLRNEDHIRTTPQVILVRAANHPKVKGTGLVRLFAPAIIKRGDEPTTGLAYQLSAYGKPIPNQLKKAWRDAMARFTAYGLANYRMEGHTVKAVDVGNLTHPKSDLVSKLMRGELKVAGNWQAEVSAKGNTKDTWMGLLPFLTRPEGHMALLRNLRNLCKNDVPASLWLPQLLAGVEKGQQLPFRYYSAYKALKGQVPPNVLDAVEECLQLSFEVGGTPHFSGRVMSLCDNSGSAWGTMQSEYGSMHIAEIANLTAVITGMLSDEGHVGVFGDRLETFGVRKRASVFDQVEQASTLGHGIGPGTENGIWLFWDRAISQAEHWDKVFIYSDMQAGHGGLYGLSPGSYKDYRWGERHIDVPKLISTYRSKVNPNVLVYLVQVAGYQDSIVPEFYNKTFILGGWGDGLLRFAASMDTLSQ